MALGFYFDMTRCVGCRACQVACKDRNNLDIGLLFRYAKTYETGSFPKVGMYNYSGSCNHCVHRLQVLHEHLPLRRTEV